jgi:hypothetical protein
MCTCGFVFYAQMSPHSPHVRCHTQVKPLQPDSQALIIVSIDRPSGFSRRRPFQAAMAEAVYHRRASRSTFYRITNPAEDGCRVCPGWIHGCFTPGLMDSHDIQCIVNCTHQNCGDVGTPPCYNNFTAVCGLRLSQGP